MTSQSAKRKREQCWEHCDKVVPGGNRARRYETQHAGVAHTDKNKDASDGKVREPKSVSEWLRYCALDLSACEVPWPLERLDRLSDLRTQPKETHDQCVAW